MKLQRRPVCSNQPGRRDDSARRRRKNLISTQATLPRYAAHFAYASPFVWMQPTYSSGSYSALLCGGTEPSVRDLAAIAATLGELDYWTPAVHKAAFALPAFVARRMSPSAPPAPPTSDES